MRPKDLLRKLTRFFAALRMAECSERHCFLDLCLMAIIAKWSKLMIEINPIKERIADFQQRTDELRRYL